MTTVKTHLSAIVAIPPAERWDAIQTIRQRWDRHVKDWMPHITLIYPFRPRSEFDAAAHRLADLGVPRFEARLATFRIFRHTSMSHTMWLDPEPKEPWVRLQAAIQERFPDCSDVQRYDGGFRPHLSVGQTRFPGPERDLQAAWRPFSFEVREIALIARADDRTPFEVVRTIPLG